MNPILVRVQGVMEMFRQELARVMAEEIDRQLLTVLVDDANTRRHDEYTVTKDGWRLGPGWGTGGR